MTPPKKTTSLISMLETNRRIVANALSVYKPRNTNDINYQRKYNNK